MWCNVLLKWVFPPVPCQTFVFLAEPMKRRNCLLPYSLLLDYSNFEFTTRPEVEKPLPVRACQELRVTTQKRLLNFVCSKIPLDHLELRVGLICERKNWYYVEYLSTL